MYRIRFHGRGGQGMKTASRILGTAFFLEGYEVQDAPRYGAERRGAPMFAYVRVSRDTIYERGVVHVPDLVVAADASLPAMPAAGVLSGGTAETILLVESLNNRNDDEAVSAFSGVRLSIDIGSVEDEGCSKAYLSSLWAGAAARLCGVISEASLRQAVTDELGHLGEDAVAKNLESALAGWLRMTDHAGVVKEGDPHPPIHSDPPQWVDCASDPVLMSAPAIRSPETSRHVKTGLWRTVRPVIDYSKCRKCWWNCSCFCPDSAITVNAEGFPVIDYAYCKGCLVCARECPRKAMEVVPEGE
ncbi:hypothetical protein DSLASN_19160 [Desulfoluna limicola]|uniref:4Fe-4S ferredoxin-type domain-containing protein n=1 Tax=Desulfoluna limicola TaxID=2810562 RepID=A0ABN6F2M6_9BACT|nr:2-oxoacid:acceptor oxidoreductase family protein [Desulfoluna limicola]BCS96284.1 hypothetical protein DSLASN_19160 [Desulfoluna limicola]